jgi:hypothetical protein
VKENKGEINQNKTVNKNITIKQYNEREAQNILRVDKYIDTTKPIIIKAGSVKFGVSKSALKKGVSPFRDALILKDGGSNFVNIKILNGKLTVNCSVFGFDDKWIVKVVNNKLITSKKDIHLYASDHYFEVFDEYYIPVLQIELDKKTIQLMLPVLLMNPIALQL